MTIIEFLYEELRKATDGGSESMTHDDALAQIQYWRNLTAIAQPVQPDANQKLLQIIAAAYQIAGVYEAPDHVLDVLANPEAATRDEIDALLPFVAAQPVAQPLLAGAVLALNELWNKSTVHAPAIADQLGICRVLAEHAMQSAQPKREPLTQPDKQRLWNDASYNNKASFNDAAMEFGILIERAHGIGDKT